MVSRFNRLPKWAKAVLGTGATILVGSLGSGFWELLFKPTLIILFNYIINRLASINESFSTRLYEDVAQGFHESYSLSLYSFILIVFAILSVAFILAIRFFVNKLNERIDQNLVKNDLKLKLLLRTVKDGDDKNINLEGPNVEENYESVMEELKSTSSSLKLEFEKSRRALRTLLFSNILIAIVLTFLVVADVARENFINSKITSFYQIYDIIGPIVDDHQAKVFLSRFRLLKSGDDYNNLLNSMKKLAVASQSGLR